MKALGLALLIPGILAFRGDVSIGVPHFSRQAISTGGRGPRWVSIADVNRDGNPDILVTNAESGTVTVLLGNGQGKFVPAPGSPFAAGSQPNDLDIADMNGDGNLDLVIPNHQTPYITILLGDGKGAFRPAPGSPFDVHSDPHPHGVAIADFNGDGRLDVMTDSWGNNQVELLTGDGRGGLRLPGQFFPVGRRPYERLRTADFNHDGHPDIVTTNLDDGTVSILLGDGKGNFRNAPGSPFAAGGKPWQLSVGDLNADGNADLAVIPYQRDLPGAGLNVLTLLAGDGHGSFTKMARPPLSLKGCEGANSVTAGTLGSLGRVIAVGCAQSRTLVLFQKRGAEYSAVSIPIEGGWGGIALGPVTRDGRSALVTGDADRGTITILTSE